jgi:tripartite-type tricarboxylate transporter receptor subunit TctC
MRRALCVLSVIAAACAAPHAAAQQYPAKPVRIVVGFAAGGPTDVIARIIAQDLTVSLGQTFIVENRAGANAVIATEAVARAAPDGYTMLFSSLSLIVNAILLENKVKYHPFKDFAPVNLAAVLPLLIVTRPSTPVNTVRELVSLAKKHPGEVTYGSAGNGGSAHLAGAMLETAAGVKMTHISYRGNAPALIDVMAGQVMFMFYPMIGIADHVAGKKLKVLAIGAGKRHPDYPSAPTMAESGFTGFEATAPWVGLIAPAGTPAPVVNRLNEEMNKSLARPESRERLRVLGAVTVGGSPADFAAFLQKDWDRWSRVIKAAGVKAE